MHEQDRVALALPQNVERDAVSFDKRLPHVWNQMPIDRGNLLGLDILIV